MQRGDLTGVAFLLDPSDSPFPWVVDPRTGFREYIPAANPETVTVEFRRFEAQSVTIYDLPAQLVYEALSDVGVLHQSFLSEVTPSQIQALLERCQKIKDEQESFL